MYSGLFYCGALVAATAAALQLRNEKEKRVPYLTMLVSGSLAFCLVFQFLDPHLLSSFERNAAEIWAGEWWRIVTALFFQDGGVSGGISNIVFLAILGSLAEQSWNKGWWLAMYFGTGIAAEFIALAWQPIGAGNSVAVFGLAAGICVYSLLRKAALSIRVFSAISALCAFVLLLGRDIHGAAFYAGIVIAFCLSLVMRPVSKKGTEDEG